MSLKVGELENKVLGKFPPDEIDENFVIERVSIFLEEMIKWEKSTRGKPIGYK